jgi:hypothetical protein
LLSSTPPSSPSRIVPPPIPHTQTALKANIKKNLCIWDHRSSYMITNLCDIPCTLRSHE